ncbi:MAG: hypothetical protein JKY52_17460 [Flavobacteriales bacterium]|nr:hypothetical protein [Flavobacteriales bacterium]
MKTADVDTSLINGYLGLLKNLSPKNKLDLIEKLSKSLKLDLRRSKKSLRRAFGAFESDRTADQLIKEIRESRTFTRQIEKL